MKSRRTLAKMAGFLMIIGLLVGCAAQQQVAPTRFFWPPLPDTPRIEWLGAYQSQLDLRPSPWYAAIIGEEEPVGLEQPLYIASDGGGKVYVSDVGKATVLEFDFDKKEAHRLGGNEAFGFFEHPTGVALDAEGNVYAADDKKKGVLVVGRDDKMKRVLDLSAEVTSIGDLAIDPARKHLIVPDSRGHKVAVFDLAGKHLFSFGKRGDGDGEFNFPLAAAVGKDGEIFVVDALNARIQRFSPEGRFILKFGQRGDNPGDFAMIKGVALDSENHVYVSDGKANSISIFSDKGDYLLSLGGGYAVTEGGKVSPGGFNILQGIYIDRNDTIFAVDQLNRRFQKFQYLNSRYLSQKPIPGYVLPQETPPAGGVAK